MQENIVAGFVIQPRLTFDNLVDKMLYQYFMTEANYKESNECSIGELIVTITSLATETGWSYGVIRGALKRLEDKRYIGVKTRSQKRGLKIKIVNYSEFQTLKRYEKSNKENNKRLTSKTQSNDNEVNNKSGSENPTTSSNEDDSVLAINNEDNIRLTNEKQSDNKEIHNTITAFITSLNSINNKRTLKHYLDLANVKSMNLTSREEILIFVEFAGKLNTFPEGTSKKILENYFDMVRLTRQTCTISARVLVNLIEKLIRYNANQINYALWLHHDQHDDKKENYTIGILRNTTDHEARRGLIKLKNQNGGVNYAVTGTSNDEYDIPF